MSDRFAANHAAIQPVNKEWMKSSNELNCHLHPLDTIASSTRAASKKIDGTVTGHLHGKDCFAANAVLQMNKLRFNDGKGDPKGFVLFLISNGLHKGLIDRYRGNRLHVLFHLCGIYHEYHTIFVNFLRTGTSCGGLKSAILKDFLSTTCRVEMQVLGLFGKFHVRGPILAIHECIANMGPRTWNLLSSELYTNSAHQTLIHISGFSSRFRRAVIR
ncbi:hypothetical protein LSH36_941g00059 [Paralvinella palmiformis]|uniref:Uncharacterized protein n=1 Tax=Paralvinella palmiformis TaxID=53620 RepID=A0AAD9IYD0_9ANNE|nr:hypothetical protein LSH36_941g00059 [Paralvinella palmiformis]